MTRTEFRYLRDRHAVEHWRVRLPRLEAWELRVRAAIRDIRRLMETETDKHKREQLDSKKTDLYWKLQGICCERATIEEQLPLRLAALEMYAPETL
jgi:hypothetical protein